MDYSLYACTKANLTPASSLCLVAQRTLTAGRDLRVKHILQHESLGWKPCKSGNTDKFKESAVFQWAQRDALWTIRCVSTSSTACYVSLPIYPNWFQRNETSNLGCGSHTRRVISVSFAPLQICAVRLRTGNEAAIHHVCLRLGNHARFTYMLMAPSLGTRILVSGTPQMHNWFLGTNLKCSCFENIFLVKSNWKPNCFRFEACKLIFTQFLFPVG